jgi:predicted CXXCH cytochrome family protein
MVDEVFNYGSFKQSKMFAAGVTCSDCHDPHSGKLRVKGDGACLQCHSSERFSAASHHRHEAVSPPVTCVNCHMPVRTYMVVDDRHDHIFNIPRPDRSLHSNTPNACNDCHRDRSPKWASDAIEAWHGPQRKGFQTYAPAFEAARARLPEAARLLIKAAGDATAPSIARATALSHLAALASPAAVAVARKALANPDPIVRIAALGVLETVPPQQVWPMAATLLSDSVRGVRIRTAFLLSSIPAAMQPERDRPAFARAAEEFVAAQMLNADRPESRSDLGTFYLRQGRFAEAEAEYNAARKLSPEFVPAFVNLADLYRRTNRETDAIGILRDGLKISPGSASLLHSLGLALVRAKAPSDESIHLLAQAAELEPENPRYSYVHAVALHSSGHPAQAIAVLQRVLGRHPGDRDSLAALTRFEQERGDLAAAIKYAEQLSAVMPEEGAVRRLIEELRRRLRTER